jgi:pyruvate kinase
MVREVAHEAGVVIPIIQDLSGPRVQHSDGHTYDASLPSITEKDIADLVFTEMKHPEYVALSFVRSASDVNELRGLLAERLLTDIKIIAKIERKEALESLDEIIEASDGIMVARGDLAEAVPFETLPFVKKDILKKCMAQGKPAVVATEMLASMTADTDPSRADITDIAQAVLDGASATMLSDETATGKFPVEAVSVMRTVVDEALEHAALQSPVRF